MPVYKNCNNIENEKARNSCTEQQLINEVYFKLKDKNIHKTEGRIMISFVVNKLGKVSDVKLLSGINDYLDAEALKAVQSLDEFEPAIHNGLPVAIKYSLPVYFKIK
jgi:TonB family protein